MPKRMLIDASHPEETRVVVLDGQKVEEFDFEAASKRPLKGNIYLAKVTRVEPSLQAAFVEYGGNRQGFLAFSEIHPDYYQIPVADRLALLAEQEAEARRRAEEDFEAVEIATAPSTSHSVAEVASAAAEGESGLNGSASPEGTDTHAVVEMLEIESESPGDAAAARGDFSSHDTAEEMAGEQKERAAEPDEGDAESDDTGPESSEPRVAELEESSAQARAVHTSRPPQRWVRRRHYKIQEVIKRRQIILVQVVKEERGTKGAALTTYLSLAGRYCVLMPNTPRGGGISRKITSATDRKRLKQAAQALELPEGMGLIIRTAGENRTKTEIKRDYEYLLRLWDQIRELTLKSNAPACVYEEGDLIKRAIRDLYNKDVSEILVEGDDGYRNAKEFMRMLMPSHAKNVKQYRDGAPLFQRHHIEAQLDQMFSPTVTLRSGGYLVINQTEALVAIDVNSGRATREHSIEDTAYKTNLEAAEEIGRQLRLRDLAGLIVIDFIDMEDARNDRNVEKRLRDCIKDDRARVQIGKISQFGLLEMSRQRLRAGVVAGSTIACAHCGGQGIVRSVESTALRVLRSVEEEGQRQRAAALLVHAPGDVAVYTLNQKRRELTRIETEYDIAIQFEPKADMMAGTFEIERIGQKSAEDRLKVPPPPPQPEAAREVDLDVVDVAEDDEDEAEDSAIPAVEVAPGEASQRPAGEGRRRRRRRRGRGREHGTNVVAQEGIPAASAAAEAARPSLGPQAQQQHARNGSGDVSNQPGEGGVRRKRRRRRRGRRNANEMHDQMGASSGEGRQSHNFSPASLRAGEEPEEFESAMPAIRDAHNDHAHILPNAPSEPVWSFASEQRIEHVPAPERSERIGPVHAEETPAVRPEASAQSAHEPVTEPPVPEPAAVASEPQPEQPPRRGWWQRPFRSRD